MENQEPIKQRPLECGFTEVNDLKDMEKNGWEMVTSAYLTKERDAVIDAVNVNQAIGYEVTLVADPVSVNSREVDNVVIVYRRMTDAQRELLKRKM